MELKKGYKQTEFGTIPEDWEICTFKDVLSGFLSGATPYRAIPDYYKGEIRWISSGELDYNNILETKEHISENARIKTNLKIHPIGTVLIAITGLEATGTRGRCAIIGKPSTTNQSCLAIYPTDKMTNKYLFCFYSYFGDYLAFKYCQGTKQQSYTAALVKKLPICCPPTIEEQTAIANALSDIDDLISALEEKIEKKKNIKQGAMQELLKPKEGWVEKRLGEVGTTYGGLTGKSKAHFGQGNAYYIPFMNILSNPIIDIYNFERVSIGVKEKQNKVLSGDLFFNTSSETPEEVGICSVILDEIDNLYLNSFCFGYRLKDKEISGLYLSYFFRSKIGRDLMTALAQGATRYNLSKSLFNQLKITLPKSIQEQNNICDIIHDMDKEIEGLVEKLEKYRMIKEGMMKDLLTGRIRLI